jgi:hypothetical protein
MLLTLFDVVVIGFFEESVEFSEAIGGGSVNWGQVEISFMGAQHRDK